jgi:hypothetical protein
MILRGYRVNSQQHLDPSASAKAPTFAVWALKDPRPWSLSPLPPPARVSAPSRKDVTNFLSQF